MLLPYNYLPIIIDLPVFVFIHDIVLYSCHGEAILFILSFLLSTQNHLVAMAGTVVMIPIRALLTGLVVVAADSCEVVEAVIVSRGSLAKAVLTMALARGEGVHARVWARTVNKGTLEQIHWCHVRACLGS